MDGSIPVQNDPPESDPRVIVGSGGKVVGVVGGAAAVVVVGATVVLVVVVVAAWWFVVVLVVIVVGVGRLTAAVVEVAPAAVVCGAGLEQAVAAVATARSPLAMVASRFCRGLMLAFPPRLFMFKP